MLRAIGFWRDPGSEDDRYRHPLAFTDPEWDASERALVADYLRSGERVTSYLGYSWCRFRCGIEDSEMGDSECSDGVWVWPEGLAHYVLEHAVRLPDPFVDHARRRSEDPERAPPRIVDADTYDVDFWVAWCAEHADPSTGYRQREESERRAIVEQLRARVPELEAEFGVGAQPCRLPGCERSVLRGMDRCAWHVAGGVV